MPDALSVETYERFRIAEVGEVRRVVDFFLGGELLPMVGFYGFTHMRIVGKPVEDRSIQDELPELFIRRTGFEPIRDIPLLGETRELKDSDLGGDALEGLSDLSGMLSTWVVIVGNDDDSSALEALGVSVSPLPRPASARRGHESTLSEDVGVLLALDYVNHLPECNGPDELG